MIDNYKVRPTVVWDNLCSANSISFAWKCCIIF